MLVLSDAKNKNFVRDGFKTQPLLTGGSVWFQPVSIVLNNDNRPERVRTVGQPAVGF